MTIIVENGTIVANANSYVSLQEVRDHYATRGVSITTEDADLEVSIIKAMDFIEGFRSRFQGYKISKTQPLQWPRYRVCIDDYVYDENEIPKELKVALFIATKNILDGVDFYPQGNGQLVKKRKIDVIETEFYGSGISGTGFGKTLILPELEQALEPLFETSGFGLTVGRC